MQLRRVSPFAYGAALMAAFYFSPPAWTSAATTSPGACVCPSNVEVSASEDVQRDATADTVDESSSADEEVSPSSSNTDPATASDDAATSINDTMPPPTADFRFNELLIDPIGTDTASEFVEIRNFGSATSSLENWTIVDGRGRVKIIVNLVVASGGYAVQLYGDTKIPLPNDGGRLELRRPDGSLADQTGWSGPVHTGWSYGRRADGFWDWSDSPTPGNENFFPENDVAAITVDAPASTTAVSSSPPPLTLPSVSDTTSQPLDHLLRGDSGARNDADLSAPLRLSRPPLITAILPHPAPGGVEWVEIANADEATADLAGWTLDDGEGGSRPYVLPAETAVSPGGRLIIGGTQSRIGLNDDGDRVRLIDRTGNVAVDVAFGRAPVGQIYILNGGAWSWSDPTSSAVATPKPVATETTVTAVSENTAAIDVAAATADAVADILEAADGEKVTVAGIVVLPPDRVGKTLAAIADTDGAAGIFIRLSRRKNHHLSVGQRVAVTGVIHEVSGNRWISAEELIADGGNDAIVYAPMSIADITGNDDGRPVLVRGVVEKSGTGWWRLTDADAAASIKATLPTGKKFPIVAMGSMVEAAGVVRYRQTGLELVMMDGGNLKITAAKNAGDVTSAVELVPEPFSAALAAPMKFRPAVSSRPALWFTATLAVAGGLSALLFLEWRRRRGLDMMEE